jgi:lipopolysaccharide cholinephosphotransferase
MEYIQLKEMQKIELDILKKFADYCDRYNLRYYLYAGTLLGAVRHHGFIPWDDDIDVVMPRPDYEKFYALSQKDKIASHLDVMDYKLSDTCICPFVKIVDNRTSGHEENLPDSFETGVWIDVFPLDGLPDGKKQQTRHIEKLQKLIKLLDLCTRKYVPCCNPLRCLKRYFIFKRYSKIDYKKVDRQLEQLATKYDYNNSTYIGAVVFGGGAHDIIIKEGFETALKLDFERYKFCVPGTYQQYLSNLFGDYMTPPPENQRVPKHSYTAWWKNESSTGSIPSDE